MSDLAAKSCVPCKQGALPLKGESLRGLLAQLPGWQAVNEHHLAKEYKFNDFVSALAFVNEIGALAEREGHHPDLTLGWGKVGVTLWTHKINGLTESDFVLAAKIDQLPRP